MSIDIDIKCNNHCFYVQMNITELAKCPETLKVYQTMFRTVKESETVDWRQHCFLVQSSLAGPAGAAAPGPRYFSTETRRDLLRVDQAWTANIVNSVIRLGVTTAFLSNHRSSLFITMLKSASNVTGFN